MEAPVRLSASYGGKIVLYRHTPVPLGPGACYRYKSIRRSGNWDEQTALHLGRIYRGLPRLRVRCVFVFSEGISNRFRRHLYDSGTRN